MAKDDENNNKVLIDLSDSTYTHGFAERNRIHQVEFDAAVSLIESKSIRLVTIVHMGRVS